MTEESETLRILKGARELIKTGWCQLKYEHHDHFCLMGALQKTAFDETGPDDLDAIYHPSYRAFEKALSALCDAVNVETPDRLTDWNDEGIRTKDEVVVAFDKAIEMEKKP